MAVRPSLEGEYSAAVSALSIQGDESSRLHDIAGHFFSTFAGAKVDTSWLFSLLGRDFGK
jgi:hypothetical protein